MLTLSEVELISRGYRFKHPAAVLRTTRHFVPPPATNKKLFQIYRFKQLKYEGNAYFMFTLNIEIYLGNQYVRFNSAREKLVARRINRMLLLAELVRGRVGALFANKLRTSLHATTEVNYSYWVCGRLVVANLSSCAVEGLEQ